MSPTHTSSRFSYRLRAVMLIAACVTGVSADAADILIRRSDGSTIRGTFEEMTRTQVVIKRSGNQTETVSVADLRDVRFDGEPTTLLSVRSNERGGALESALEKLQAVRSDYSGNDNRLETDLAFLQARMKVRLALNNPEQADEALQEIEAFRTSNPDNFRYFESTLLHAQLLAAAGNAAQGQTLLEEVRTSGVPGFELQAGVQLGRLLLESGDTGGAASAFDGVIGIAGSDPTAKAALFEAQLGKALCERQQGQLDAAISTIDSVIGSADPSETEILAEAWVRKGDCLRQKNEPKAALMAYLHVDVLYQGATEHHAEALLRLSELWGPAGHIDRAQDASARLTQKYPNSTFARQLTN